jgi:hypothetical protein
VSISFHDVVDSADELDTDAVTTRSLAQFFDWLKGSGWTAVSLDDLARRPRHAAAARQGDPDHLRRRLQSLYTRVFPLLQVYRFPTWRRWRRLDGGEARRHGRLRRQDGAARQLHLVAEAREMQASGLVEFASHSYDLHRGMQANPQGSMTPAAVTWRYDPATARYEDDGSTARASAPISRARAASSPPTSAARRGAWCGPIGATPDPASRSPRQLGFTFSLTLEPSLATRRTCSPSTAISRRAIPAWAKSPTTCASMPPGPGPAHRLPAARRHGRRWRAARRTSARPLIEDVRTLGANTVMIHAYAALRARRAARRGLLPDSAAPSRPTCCRA